MVTTRSQGRVAALAKRSGHKIEKPGDEQPRDERHVDNQPHSQAVLSPSSIKNTGAVPNGSALGTSWRALIGSSPPTSWMALFVVCLCFRALNAVLVCTYFNADEFWQSLEVAHQIVFGYGYLTWEWRSGLRSYLHPLVFAALYKLLAVLGLDTPLTLALAPRLLQALFAALGDVALYRLALCWFSPAVAGWAVACSAGSWFTFFCGVRTFSNCLEAVLTASALALWPPHLPAHLPRPAHWGPPPAPHRAAGVLLAGLSVILRPTSLLVWIPLGVRELLVARDRWRFLGVEVAGLGAAVVAGGTVVDSACYGRLVVVPWNFLRFNLLEGGAAHYGTHPPHWYFTQGLPAVLFTLLPLTLYGIWSPAAQHRRFPAAVLLFVVLAYSCIPHKEFRFVLPVLPLALLYAAAALDSLCTPGGDRTRGGPAWGRRRRQALLALVFLPQVGAALYLSCFHQRGTIVAIKHIAEEARAGAVGGSGVLFLTPCHHSPFYSHVHEPVPMRILDCSPPPQRGLPDESDLFFEDPGGFLQEKVFGAWRTEADAVPSHVVMYDQEALLLEALPVLLEQGYRQTHSIPHSHLATDKGLQRNVLIYKRLADAST